MNLLKHTKPIEAEFDALRREIRSNNISFQRKVDQLSQENISTDNLLNNTITVQQTLVSQVDSILNEPDAPPPTDYYVPLTGAYYLGDGTTEGDWRIIRNNNNLEIQRLESSVWTVKFTFTP